MFARTPSERLPARRVYLDFPDRPCLEFRPSLHRLFGWEFRLHVNQRFKISIAVAYRREDAKTQLRLPSIPVKRRIFLSLFVLVRQFFHRDPYGYDSRQAYQQISH